MREIDEALDGRRRLRLRRDEHDRHAARLLRLPAPSTGATRSSSPSTPSEARCSAGSGPPARCPASAPASRPSSRAGGVRPGRPRIRPRLRRRLRRLVAREAILAAARPARWLRRCDRSRRICRRQPLRAHLPRRRRGLPATRSTTTTGSRRRLGRSTGELAALVDRSTRRLRRRLSMAAAARRDRRRSGRRACSRSSGCLVTSATRGSPTRLSVDLFEPHPAPGRGAGRRPSPARLPADELRRRSLDMWRASAGPSVRRAAVVRRLARCDARRALPAARARRSLPRRRPSTLPAPSRAAGCAIGLRRCAVESVEPARAAGVSRRGRRDVHLRRGARDGRARDRCGRADGTAERAGEPTRRRWCPPSSRWSAGSRRERVAAGAVVAVRGFALTFIDAALALTEGRGGRSRARPSVPAALHADRRRRRRAACRTRAPVARCSPSPTPNSPTTCRRSRRSRGPARRRSSRCPTASRCERGLLAILARHAAAALLAANGREPAGEPWRRATATARRWLDDRLRRDAHRDASSRRRRRSSNRWRSAPGSRPPDLPWALGHMWRDALSRARRSASAATDGGQRVAGVLRLAAQMERVSFGPPPGNAAKLLALIDAGRVDLTHVGAADADARAARSPRFAAHAASGESTSSSTRCCRRPASAPATAGVVGRLLADGHVRVRARASRARGGRRRERHRPRRSAHAAACR